MEGSQFPGKVTQSAKTTRSRPNAWLTNEWLGLTLHIQDLAKTILRREEPGEEWTDAQGNAAFPTPQEFLVGILLEIVGQLKWQRRHGFHEQQQELYETMASAVMACTLKESDRRK